VNTKGAVGLSELYCDSTASIGGRSIKITKALLYSLGITKFIYFLGITKFIKIKNTIQSRV